MPMKVRYTVLDREVVSENRNDIARDYVPDPLGSTVALLDSTHSKTDTFSYWPYGETRSRTGSNPTAYRFVGTAGYYTDSTNRAYVRARHLGLHIGSWETVDPNSLDPRPQPYRYVGNSPASWTDPSGAVCIPCLLIVGFVIIGTITGCRKEPKLPPKPIKSPPMITRPYKTPRDAADFCKTWGEKAGMAFCAAFCEELTNPNPGKRAIDCTNLLGCCGDIYSGANPGNLPLPDVLPAGNEKLCVLLLKTYLSRVGIECSNMSL
jgi:RHS repeat-associated protein